MQASDSLKLVLVLTGRVTGRLWVGAWSRTPAMGLISKGAKVHALKNPDRDTHKIDRLIVALVFTVCLKLFANVDDIAANQDRLCALSRCQC